MSTSSLGQGVYWVGNDGKTYVKASGIKGVQSFAGGTMPDAQSLGLTQIADPNSPNGVRGDSTNTGDTTQVPSSGYGSGSSRTVTTSYTPAEISTLEAAEQRNQRLLGSLGVARDASLQNIGNQYATNQNRYNDAQAQANKSFNTQKRDNEDSKAAAFNRIDDNAGQTYNNTMRFLGVRGAGKSSAAEITAPTLISQQASGQRADQLNTYNKNKESIANAQQASDIKYRNLHDDLTNWKNTSENTARQSFVNNENDILSNLANAQSQLAAARGGNAKQPLLDYNANFERNQATLGDLTRNSVAPSYVYQTVDTTPASTAQYAVDPTALANGATTDDPTATDMNTYLPWLLKQRELGLLG